MRNLNTVVITSGYYNPLHSGHCEYLMLAARLGDYHVAIINNDNQVTLKGSQPFQDEKERSFIVSSLKSVDETFISIDSDSSVCRSIEAVVQLFLNQGYTGPFIFAKGGDRTAENIPEMGILNKYNIKLVSGLGAKIQSSSSLKKRIQDRS